MSTLLRATDISTNIYSLLVCFFLLYTYAPLAYFEKELNWSCEWLSWPPELERFKTCIYSEQYYMFYPKEFSFFWCGFLFFFTKWMYHYHSHRNSFNQLSLLILSLWLYLKNNLNYYKILSATKTKDLAHWPQFRLRLLLQIAWWSF